MKPSILSLSLAVSGTWSMHVFAEDGSIEGWAPAGPDDFRGPCPMMNTLANHGYLPHDGRNLTKEAVVKGLGDGLNFDPALAELMFEQAIFVNTEPNATYFTLDMLNPHNLLEHDASLSRSDAYFGNNHVFNETVFEETLSYWPDEIVNANSLAMAKVARQVTSKAFNPTYRFTSSIENFSIGELLAPIVALGDRETSTVNRTLMEYFFRNERLPAELGWVVTTDLVTLDDITHQMEVLSAAANLITSDNATASDSAAHARRHKARRSFAGGLHGSFV